MSAEPDWSIVEQWMSYLGGVDQETSSFRTSVKSSEYDNGLSNNLLGQTQQHTGGLSKLRTSEANGAFKLRCDAIELGARARELFESHQGIE